MSSYLAPSSQVSRYSLPDLHFFFFNDTATTEIYTLSLHDALPISPAVEAVADGSSDQPGGASIPAVAEAPLGADRKSTRLNSSQANISYAVFCLKKKNVKYP